MSVDEQPVDPAVTSAFVTASRALVAIAVRSIQHAAVPVTVPQHRVLVLLSDRGPLGVGQLAELSGVDQSNASRLCDRLEKLHLVGRERSGGDGRVVRVRLTPEGRRVLDSVTSARRREVEEVLQRLTAAERRAAIDALEAFSAAAHEAGPRTPRSAGAARPGSPAGRGAASG